MGVLSAPADGFGSTLALGRCDHVMLFPKFADFAES
jgi:hypothetical protein